MYIFVVVTYYKHNMFISFWINKCTTWVIDQKPSQGVCLVMCRPDSFFPSLVRSIRFGYCLFVMFNAVEVGNGRGLILFLQIKVHSYYCTNWLPITLLPTTLLSGFQGGFDSLWGVGGSLPPKHHFARLAPSIMRWVVFSNRVSCGRKFHIRK